MGTILKLKEQGTQIHYSVFSICAKSVPNSYPKTILKAEVREVGRALKLTPNQLQIHDFPVREFPEFRQEILEILIKEKTRLRPDLVLLPALSDIHQDHIVIAQEGLRAFKHSSILGYELPMNTIEFQHSCFVKLDLQHIQRKIEILTHYKSQQFRPYMKPDFVFSLAKVRGIQCNAEYAEAFEVIRWQL